MDPKRVVEVFGSRMRGSGYLIAPRLVLTAHHVVEPATIGAACAILPLLPIDPNSTTAPVQLPAKLVWFSERHDVALVELREPIPFARPIPFADVPKDGVARDIIAAGFPEAAGDKQRTIIGKLTWQLKSPPRFDLDIISALPSDSNKWGGFSGASIFCDTLLVGVICTLEPGWDGLLAATPTACLRDDPQFETYFEQAGHSLPKCVDLGEADRLMPLDFEKDTPLTGPLRFSPRNSRVPFLGRETALTELDAFVHAERGQPFAWWLVTGGGGAGKTRLARELCLRMRHQGWRAGFLPNGFAADLRDLNAWCPRSPTLIVADYVMKRMDEIRKLAARLARRDGLPPIRLLLLERESGDLFETRFLGSDTSDRSVIESARFRPEPLAIERLSDEHLWDLVVSCPWRDDGAGLQLDRDAFFEHLSRMDRLRRPLVAMILADSLVANPLGAVPDVLDSVLRHLITRERDHLWPLELGVAKSAAWNTEADVAIAFATMVDGLDKAGLKAISEARGQSINREILPACAVAIGKPLGKTAKLERLEPDLIGEFFTLEALRGTPDNPFAKPTMSWMPEVAWRTNGRAMWDFVSRANQSFPNHSALAQVNIDVSGVAASYLSAAVNKFIQESDLIKWFDAIRLWLVPRAHSDVAAADAFTVIALAIGTSEVVDGPLLSAYANALGDLYQAHHGLELHVKVAASLMSLADRLNEVGCGDDAISCCDILLSRLDTAPELSLREVAAKAMFNKGGTLAELGRSEDAIVAYDDLISRFGA